MALEVHPVSYILIMKFFLTFIHFLIETERERGRGRERGRHRIWRRLQVLSCQHRAWSRALIHEPWDHDLSRGQTPNQLSHPGAPWIGYNFVRGQLIGEFFCVMTTLFTFTTLLYKDSGTEYSDQKTNANIRLNTQSLF